jgi:hypothetical protein
MKATALCLDENRFTLEALVILEAALRGNDSGFVSHFRVYAEVKPTELSACSPLGAVAGVGFINAFLVLGG